MGWPSTRARSSRSSRSRAPTGARVLPVFASVDAMSRWNPAARPVPADGVRVALAAADDGTDLVVLDPGSETEFVLRRPAVWAVAQSQPWHPPFDSADVRAAFERSIGTELAVLGVELDAGDPDARLAGPELVVRLVARGRPHPRRARRGAPAARGPMGRRRRDRDARRFAHGARLD